MSMNIKKILDAAEELKLATLRAKEVGVIKFDTLDNTILVNEETFKELFINTKYEIATEKNGYFGTFDYMFKYTGFYQGQKFETYSRKLLFEEVKDA